MPVATFDTLKFANTLKAAGVPAPHAEAEAAAIGEVLQINFKELATKDDLKESLKNAKDELRAEIAHLRDLFKWVAGVIIAINMATLAFVLRTALTH